MTIFNKILILVLLLLVGNANNYVNPTPFVFVILLTLFAFIFNIITGKKIQLKVYLPFLILFFIHSVHAIFFGRLNFGTLTSLLLALTIIGFEREKFIHVFLFHMNWLSILSLILFIPTLINISSFTAFLNHFQNLLNITISNYDGAYKANVIFYTINSGSVIRNCGFMWEPGPFASILSLAIFFELIINQFVLNRRIYVFSIALLTTLSTTGYLCLLVLFMFYFYNKYHYSKFTLFFYSIFLTISIVYVVNLNFVGDKISRAFDTNFGSYIDNITYIKKYEAGGSTSYSLGRVQGLMLNYEDFVTSPIIGIGSPRNSEVTRVYGSLQSMNGLGNVLAKYGILGIFFLFFALYKTSFWLKRRFDIKLSFAFAIIYFIQAFSFPFVFSSFYFVILFLYLSDYQNLYSYNSKV